MRITRSVVLLCLFAAVYATSTSQQRYLYIYDHASMTTDSMPITEATAWLTVATPWSAGAMLGRSDLPQQLPPPTDMVGSMSRMRPAREFTNVAHYPARTVGSLRIMRDGIPQPSCSASLVGPRWVITSAHCLYEIEQNPMHRHWDYRFYPAWDDSSSQTIVPFARVIRTYTVRVPQKSPLENDIALLELDVPIGRELGWLGMLSFPDPEFVQNIVAHRLSYPAYSDILDPTRVYDGDTMWYRYGAVQHLDGMLYTDGAVGIPGESGSAVIIPHDGGYAATAVLQYAYGMGSRQPDSTTFETFARIIMPTIASVGDGQGAGTSLENEPGTVQLFNMQGEIVVHDRTLPSGVYLEVTTSRGHHTTRKISILR